MQDLPWQGGGPYDLTVSSSPSDSKQRQLEMVSFSFDPQWCGLLFSVYCRHEKGASLLGSTGLSQADTFACSMSGPPLDADWIALAGSVGLEFCTLSSTWALIFESVKATGVIFLVGIGSLVCYRIYNYYFPRYPPRLPSPNSSPSPDRRRPVSGDLLEDGGDMDMQDIEGRYFGPSSTVQPPLVVLDETDSDDLDNSWAMSDGGTSGGEESRDADVSDGSQGEKSPPVQNVLRRQTLVWSEYPLHLKQPSSRTWRKPKHMPLATASLHASSRGNLHSVDDSGWLMKRITNMMGTASESLQLSGNGSLSLPVTPGRWIKPNLRHIEKRTNHIKDGYATFQELDVDPNISLMNYPPYSCHTPPSYSEPLVNTSPNMPRLTRDESFDSLGFSRGLPREGSFDSTCSDFSLDFSLPESSADTATMLNLEKLQHEIDQLKSNCLMMDEEFETIKCNRNLPGMSSLMKANTSQGDFPSDEVGLPPDADSNESLKEEKARACFAGLYSITTIKNSTSSELSDSFPPLVQGVASLGSAESLDWDSPKLAISPAKFSLGNVSEDFIGDDDPEMIEHPSLTRKHVPVNSETSFLDSNISPCLHRVNTSSVSKPPLVSQSSNLTLAPSEADLMANLEWDEEDLLEYPDEGSNDVLTNVMANSDLLVIINTLEVEAELDPEDKTDCKAKQSEEPESMASSYSCLISPLMERSKMESSGFGSKMLDSCISNESSQLVSECEGPKPWTCWSSEESGYMEWDGAADRSTQSKSSTQQCWDETTAMVQSSSNTSEQSTPASENPPSELVSPISEVSTHTTVPPLKSIGQKLNVFQYAVHEWKGQTDKAATILKGYAEIPLMMGLQHIRQIRGDNYCGIRAAIFQTLANGFPVPSGAVTFDKLSEALNSKRCSWLQDWNFATHLPYQGNNVLHGMEVCLRSLDNVASLILSSEDHEEALAALLNSDVTLDLHVVEAVKLHMMHSAMELHEANSNGSDIPLFAILMFARDTSETPKDLMNNHLREVGNTGGLEQVEMFLLGYTLGVTLRVVRPSAYGTEGFVCSYPDWNDGTWPQVVLIAEDDRHYNILVQ